jgi:hypothetical protein
MQIDRGFGRDSPLIQRDFGSICGPERSIESNNSFRMLVEWHRGGVPPS